MVLSHGPDGSSKNILFSCYSQKMGLNNYLLQMNIYLKTLILLLLSLIMEPRKGDEHLHHPVCEVCQKEFDDVHELSKHVNEEHRIQDRAA